MATVQPPVQDDRSLAELLAKAIDFHQNGQIAQAEPLYLRLVQAKPDHFDALHMLGVIRHQQGRDPEALALIDTALAARPSSVWALANRGVVLNVLQRHDEALACFDRVLARNPRDIEALNNRGNALRDLKRFADALASYERALALKPDYVEALNNRGNALQGLKRYSEALASYEQALALKPGYVDALYNRGAALQALNRHGQAIVSYQAALAIDPDHADSHWNESLARLCLGDFGAGWQKFEWRWRTRDATTRRDWPQPLWLGEAPIAGKTVLLYCEQGVGDTLQFVRYVPFVAARGARIVLAVHRELTALLADYGGAAVVSEDDALPAFDLRCPLLSLPHAFETRLDTIPAKVPYLQAAKARIAQWRARLASEQSLQVGLVWSGNPRHDNDRNRSIALERLAPILAVPDIAFVGLQKDVRSSDAGALRAFPNLLDLSPELADFADTAAVIAQLDLVISVDTAVVHLAGGMAKPVWVLLPFSPDWRWLLERDDSPWYPSARLFRQSAIDDWASVIARVADELTRWKSAIPSASSFG